MKPDTEIQDLTIRPAVMIVDDEEPYTDVMSMVLEGYGFDVYPANSVSAAWELLDQVTPDLILLDVMMPNVDGLTFLRELRAHARLYVSPVLVITAYPETRPEAFESGAVGYLTKPFSAQKLRETISDHLRVDLET